MTDKIKNGYFDSLNHMPYAILIVDSDGKVIFRNIKYEKSLREYLASDKKRQAYEVELLTALAKEEQNLEKMSLMKESFFGLTFGDLNTYFAFTPYKDGAEIRKVVTLWMDKVGFHQEELDLLRQEYKLLMKILDSSFDGIYITDEKGTTLYFNDAFVKISGFSREESIGKTTEELVEVGYLPKSCSMEVIKKRQAICMNIDYHNGIEGMLSGQPVFDDNGNLIRTVLNVRDMTELNKVNKELKQAESLTTSYRQQLKEVQLEYQEEKEIIYRSQAMKNIVDLGVKVADVDAPVLLLGESGVGKDVLAHFIHEISDRNDKGNFVKINCGAIPENLLESELFGYEKGAFTGALSRGKAGLFELADGGTFFLDEIGDMPLNLQVKILDVLQEKKISRLGSTKRESVDVRIIAATNKDLEQMVEEKKFRLDLYYRLNVIPIMIPPLRERKDDIMPLAEFFIRKINKKYNKKKLLSQQIMNLFMSYGWPGNVRELYNIIERLVLTTEEKEITANKCPLFQGVTEKTGALLADEKQGTSLLIDTKLELREYMEQVEKEYISYHLERNETLKEAAGEMGIDISTLVRKKKRHAL